MSNRADSDAPKAAESLRIVRAGVEDAAEILPVLQRAFPDWPAADTDVSPLEHLQWKMAGPPGAPDHPHTIVRSGETTVAVQVRWLAHARVGEQTIPYDRGTDLAVDPDHQGKGIARFIFDDDATRNPPLGSFIRWDTMPNSPQVLHLEADDIIPRQLRVWARTFEVRTHLGIHRRAGSRHLLEASARRAVRAIHQLIPSRGATGTPPGRISELATFDERTDDVWESASRQFDLARVRDAALMNWRFRDPRGGRATALGLEDGDRLLGYVVFKQHAAEGRIVDLVVRPEHPAVATALLEAASTRLRAEGARAVICWLPAGHPSEPALGAAGFLDTTRPQALMLDLTWMGAAEDAVRLVRDASCRPHITMGDFDFV